MIGKPKRGRPATGKALTPAQKQKAYRERVKAERGEMMTLTIHRDERELLIELVHAAYLTAKASGDAFAYIPIANLGRRLEALRR